MRGVERGRDLGDDPHGTFRRKLRFAREQVREVEALDVPHGDEEVLLGLAGLIDRDHVGVIDGGRGLPFALEPLPEGAVAREVGGDQLQGDGSPERDLGRSVDNAHAATAGFRLDAVTGEGGAGRECGG